MAPLLYRVAADSAHSNYIDRILGAIDLDAIAQPSAAEAQLVEPLSDREIEVLECISEGLSNREIAQRLTIALSTVKSHTRNIYSKMGVNSRTQAIAHARAWGILTAS
jgi:LuxR family maltose regulon positive regulatory protein